jgi:5-methyltetrahydropteroyltriglutamate--homocysteine methyltransferase
MTISIPTEQIGSIPRPAKLIEAYDNYSKGKINTEDLDKIALEATIDTIQKLEKTGSPCISDGEQLKFESFASYCFHGAKNLKPGSASLIFTDGHKRIIPHLTKGPFSYQLSADTFLKRALQYTSVPLKQAVISPSMISFAYPNSGILDYSRPEFIKDLLADHIAEVKHCLELGAHTVQIDFTEGRYSLKLDPSGELLSNMVDLINNGLASFSEEDRERIGIHTCPGSDKDTTHSQDIDYKELLPTLFKINAGKFFVAMAGEKEPERALRMIKLLLRPGIRVFIGVINPIDSNIETPEIVRDRVIQAAKFIPVNQLGTTDDCGFSPFVDDFSTSRDIAFSKIKARVEGTKLAEIELGR